MHPGDRHRYSRLRLRPESAAWFISRLLAGQLLPRREQSVGAEFLHPYPGSAGWHREHLESLGCGHAKAVLNSRWWQVFGTEPAAKFMVNGCRLPVTGRHRAWHAHRSGGHGVARSQSSNSLPTEASPPVGRSSHFCIPATTAILSAPSTWHEGLQPTRRVVVVPNPARSLLDVPR